MGSLSSSVMKTSSKKEKSSEEEVQTGALGSKGVEVVATIGGSR